MILSIAALLGTGPTAWAACACTGMTIHHANNTNVTICSNASLNFSECTVEAGSDQNGCAGMTHAYQCPVGVNSPTGLKQQTGFGVEATLTGTAAECHSGQALQLTLTSDQGVTKPKVHATPAGNIAIGNYTVSITNDTSRDFPDVNATSSFLPFYGGDTYTDAAANDYLIQQTANGIKWWDNTDQGKDAAGENANWHYRYYSFVQGTAVNDGCGCVFDIDVIWPPNTATPTTTYSLVNGSSMRCHF